VARLTIKAPRAEDIGSIGVNLIEHPGIETFYRVLKEIRKRNDVQDVLIIINQIDEHLDWPFSDSLYILTSCSKEQVSEWVKPIKPDDIAEGWTWGKPPAVKVVRNIAPYNLLCSSSPADRETLEAFRAGLTSLRFYSG